MSSYRCYNELMEELWDIARVASYLGVTERTVYNKVRSGELSAVKVGRLWRVRPTDLEAWLATRGRRAEARVQAPNALPTWRERRLKGRDLHSEDPLFRAQSPDCRIATNSALV